MPVSTIGPSPASGHSWSIIEQREQCRRFGLEIGDEGRRIHRQKLQR